MTEKEREQEIYRRTEQRDLLMRRFEMRQKIKQQQRQARLAEKNAAKKGTIKNKSKNSSVDDKKGLVDSTNDLNQGQSSMTDRRKANESKKKDTSVSKALANLKADREKKKQQGKTKMISTFDNFTKKYFSIEQKEREHSIRLMVRVRVFFKLKNKGLFSYLVLKNQKKKLNTFEFRLLKV
jgi:hypothetical protein